MPDSLYIPIVLQLVGVVVILAEIILPSGGILSVLAAGLIGYSLYSVFANASAGAGLVFIIVDLVTLPILVFVGIKLMAKSPATLRTMLSRQNGVNSQSADENRYLGAAGRALTDLRPSGMALINEERVDVVTRGEYLEKGSDVIVIAVRGNQIIVKQPR